MHSEILSITSGQHVDYQHHTQSFYDHEDFSLEIQILQCNDTYDFPEFLSISFNNTFSMSGDASSLSTFCILVIASDDVSQQIGFHILLTVEGNNLYDSLKMFAYEQITYNISDNLFDSFWDH